MSALAAFLRDHLLEHADIEERELYPVVERLLRSLGGATKTMTSDHRAIAEKVEGIESLSKSLGSGVVGPAERAQAARLLYGVAALLENHFTKEEEIYLPLLESGLTADEARDLAERLAPNPPRPSRS